MTKKKTMKSTMTKTTATSKTQNNLINEDHPTGWFFVLIRAFFAPVAKAKCVASLRICVNYSLAGAITTT